MIITYPHREEPIVQATRAAVVILLLVSAALVFIVTVGGWNQLEGMYPVDLAYVIVYLVLAYFARRWNRGVLPVGAALAVLLGVFALVAAPGWFTRDGFGYEESGLNASLLGILTLIIVPCRSLSWCSRCAGSNRAGTSSASGVSRPLSRAASPTRPRTPPDRPAPRLSSACVVTLRRWRNGRRGALKRPCPRGRVGSSPTRRIN